MKSTGHKDIDGNWVEETPQAKLRNQLGPFWTLIDILSSDRLDKTLSNDEDLVKRLVNQCNENRRTIIELIKKTENNM
jgi:hypothetical protein